MLPTRTLAFIAAACLACAQQPQKTTIVYQCVPEELDAAGLTCTTAHPCPIYLELASIENVAGKLFLAGNLHTEDVTLASILLASEDGGRLWTEPFKRMVGVGLEQIQFIDFQNGWIGGQTLQGRPRDAFLLVTHDGGKTWQQHLMFEDGRGGVIQQFSFDSKSAGSLIIDRLQPSETGSRWELYESQTGGDSWDLREVSAKQLRIKRSRTAEVETDWRLRADAPSKTYRVEHRQSDRWATVSIFPIHVTDCRVVEATLAEPPPDQPEPPPPPAKPSLRKKP